MQAYISRITPVIPTANFIQWEIVPDNGVNSSYTAVISRSGSPSGPWTAVSPVLTNQVNYTDVFDAGNDRLGQNQEVNLLALDREIYYTVTVTCVDNLVQVTSPPVNIDGLAETTYLEQQPYLGQIPLENSQREPDPRMREAKFPSIPKTLRLLRRKILRDEYIAFRELVGIQIVVLKRMRYGKRCQACYDPLTRASISSKCQICYGTSWQGGYWQGILTYGKISPAPVQTSVSPQGLGDLRSVNITLLSFPKVEFEDILVEVASSRRFQVMQVANTELRRMVVHQRIIGSELGRGGVEYLIPTGINNVNSGTILSTP